MRPVEDLKIRPFRHLKPSIDDSDIREIELAFAVQLPSSYSAFLLRQNGGRPKLREVRYGIESVVDLEMIYGIGYREADERAVANDPHAWDYCNLWGELRVRQDELPPGAIPIGRDGSGSVFYADCLGERPGAVRLQISSTRRHTFVCDSFEELINLLRLPSDRISLCRAPRSSLS